MSGIATEIVIILLMLVANGVFAMSEIAIISARKARLQQRADEGDRGAKAALELANAPNRFLSTVQVGITLVGIFAGAFGGATVAEKLAAALRSYPALAPYSNPLALATVVVCITYLSLVIGELVPKRLGLNSPERIAAAMARPMSAISKMASPLVSLLGASTDFVIRLLRVKPAEEPPVTEEEINVLIAQGAEAGVFEKAERDIIQRLFRLGNQTVGALMTPRRLINWIDLEDPPEQCRKRLAAKLYSRFVVCHGGLDQVRGVVSIKDLLAQSLAGKPLDLAAALQQPHFVPRSQHTLRVLDLFKTSGIHIALVVDEYGGVEGLVTLSDLLEAMVGDMPPVGAPPEPQAVKREDGSWLIDGLVPMEEFKTLLGIAELPGERAGSFRTAGGFVVAQIGRVPAVADHFGWQGLRFEVVDMDGNRVDKILVAPLLTRNSTQ